MVRLAAAIVVVVVLLAQAALAGHSVRAPCRDPPVFGDVWRS
jgi:hypothetical protein